MCNAIWLCFFKPLSFTRNPGSLVISHKGTSGCFQARFGCWTHNFPWIHGTSWSMINILWRRIRLLQRTFRAKDAFLCDGFLSSRVHSKPIQALPRGLRGTTLLRLPFLKWSFSWLLLPIFHPLYFGCLSGIETLLGGGWVGHRCFGFSPTADISRWDLIVRSFAALYQDTQKSTELFIALWAGNFSHSQGETSNKVTIRVKSS